MSNKICKNGKSRQSNKSNITDIVVVEGIDADATDSLVGSSEVEYDNSQVRLFIALFDYNPASMSPNNDAADEELPFCEGQLLKVIVFIVFSLSFKFPFVCLYCTIVA